MGNSVQKIIGLGQNMARKVGRCFQGGRFEGSVQRMGGKTVTDGLLHRNGNLYNYTKIYKETPDGSRTVSRMYRDYSGRTSREDLTKITNETTSNVGNFRVNTFNQKSYEYGDKNLFINEKTVDRVFSGKHHIGGRAVYKHDDKSAKKYFFGPDGNVLKTINYNPQGLRTFAELPDGRVLRYDAKGLPTFTNAQQGYSIDFEGLDKLI